MGIEAVRVIGEVVRMVWVQDQWEVVVSLGIEVTETEVITTTIITEATTAIKTNPYKTPTEATTQTTAITTCHLTHLTDKERITIPDPEWLIKIINLSGIVKLLWVVIEGRLITVICLGRVVVLWV